MDSETFYPFLSLLTKCLFDAEIFFFLSDSINILFLFPFGSYGGGMLRELFDATAKISVYETALLYLP